MADSSKEKEKVKRISGGHMTAKQKGGSLEFLALQVRTLKVTTPSQQVKAQQTENSQLFLDPLDP